jgi:catechol 2,3-dioxygenase-like lactoylglutathione lyase family enzyme
MTAMSDARLFRIVLRVSDLDRAEAFYSKLLDAKGRRVGGGRLYFDCGPVILALLATPQPSPAPVSSEDIYFAVANLEAFHARAAELACLSHQQVHDDSGGEIHRRPWGERSFYAEDPWGNGLCFVDEHTVFTGFR